MTELPDWREVRRRAARRDARRGWRALATRPVTVAVTAAVVVAGAAAGLIATAISHGPPPPCQRVFVPSYFTPDIWQQAAGSRPAPSVMILNPATGIGAGNSPNPSYQSAVGQARAAGSAVLGYVSTAAGQRPVAQIEADVRNYKAWYGVTGIFLDVVNGEGSQLPYYTQLANYIHRVIPGSSVWLNPGIYPDQGYMSVADVVMVFEGTYAQYRAIQVPGWARDYPAARFANTIYDVPSRSDAGSAISLSRSRNAGYVYVTNLAGSNPYNALPSYWPSVNDAITAGCGSNRALLGMMEDQARRGRLTHVSVG